jgi:hypothetical protein
MWNERRWHQELERAGWTVDAASRAWTNEWIVNNRLSDLRLSDAGGNEITWPHTHCLMVARREVR